MDKESQTIFKALFNEVPNDNLTKPHEFDLVFKSHVNYIITHDVNRLIIWLKIGGCLILNPDGTWGGDVAPFCD